MDLWPPVVLQKLASSYKVILFENRGMGFSTIINDTSVFSMKLFARDAANLMNALNISKAHIMDRSMGTYIAEELALGYPEKVDKVILYAADCGNDITIQPDSALWEKP
jgi:pimeloyl-ACP methyl ester carboxylesterase